MVPSSSAGGPGGGLAAIWPEQWTSEADAGILMPFAGGSARSGAGDVSPWAGELTEDVRETLDAFYVDWCGHHRLMAVCFEAKAAKERGDAAPLGQRAEIAEGRGHRTLGATAVLEQLRCRKLTILPIHDLVKSWMRADFQTHPTLDMRNRSRPRESDSLLTTTIRWHQLDRSSLHRAPSTHLRSHSPGSTSTPRTHACSASASRASPGSPSLSRSTSPSSSSPLSFRVYLS